MTGYKGAGLDNSAQYWAMQQEFLEMQVFSS